MEISSDQAERLAARIRRRRLQLDLRQEDAARLGGISVATWRNAERALPTMTERTLAALDKGLDWHPGSAAALLAGKDIQEHEPAGAEARSEPLISLIEVLPTPRRTLLGYIVGDMAAATLRSQSWQLQLVDDLYTSDNIEAFYESLTRDFVHTSLMMGELEDFELFIRSIIEDEESKYEEAAVEAYDPYDHLPMAADEDDRTGDNVRRIRPSPESSDDFPD